MNKSLLANVIHKYHLALTFIGWSWNL